LNKPNKNKFKYMHAYFLYFYIFYFLLFLGLDPAQPMGTGLGWTHPAQPGRWSKPVARRPLPARVRELFTHAGNS
jgi:hypothetical protein